VAYATVTELFRLLSITSPTADQTTAAQRCLDASTHEIDDYLSRVNAGTAIPAFTPEKLALATQVNLDRAVEHWRQTPYGAMAQGPDMTPVITGRDSFERHRVNLQSLKFDWGVG
jgi:hypothetical protein